MKMKHSASAVLAVAILLVFIQAASAAAGERTIRFPNGLSKSIARQSGLEFDEGVTKLKGRDREDVGQTMITGFFFLGVVLGILLLFGDKIDEERG